MHKYDLIYFAYKMRRLVEGKDRGKGVHINIAENLIFHLCIVSFLYYIYM